MGYRLECSNVSNTKCWCGGKLYGYISYKENKLKSFKYLLKIGKFDNDTDIQNWLQNKLHPSFMFWEEPFSHKILLTKDEFIKFINLYIKDWINCYGYECPYIQYGLNEFCFDEEDKIIEWC